ncbi:hypothetical protein CDL12_24502 [Handroanthus impetiginosus]|uniref:Pectinesterase n=1 Tax=Handroanthus impetiginosus TaxID=429701 RepID=A0A2G9GCF7_9LAMI|nr:hypothetical protein CDL12_24502 [Handroanthus impetiginosus]
MDQVSHSSSRTPLSTYVDIPMDVELIAFSCRTSPGGGRISSDNVDAFGDIHLLSGDVDSMAGEYQEVVQIGPNKTNLSSIGDEIKKTMILSAVTFDDHWAGATLCGSVGSFEPMVLGIALGGYAFIVVMQSYLDASIFGYLINSSPSSTPFFAIFGNTEPGATMKTIPSYVHALSCTKAAQFSLRDFLDGDNWIAPWVEYNLNLTRQ